MTSALLPYMVTVTTTTPITPLFLPNPVLFTIRLVSRSNFWKCWLFSVTLDPGKFALKTFVRYIPSRHPPIRTRDSLCTMESPATDTQSPCTSTVFTLRFQ
jgi:hypothetical protein